MSRELENRFFLFAKAVRDFCRQIPHDTINTIYIRQLIRSGSSIPANYIEASDDLGNADEKMKIKIARRESKESILWLSLILTGENENLEKTRLVLVDECKQIRKILSAILIKLN
jgi:four helix bundle protein